MGTGTTGVDPAPQDQQEHEGIWVQNGVTQKTNPVTPNLLPGPESPTPDSPLPAAVFPDPPPLCHKNPTEQPNSVT